MDPNLQNPQPNPVTPNQSSHKSKVFVVLLLLIICMLIAGSIGYIAGKSTKSLVQKVSPNQVQIKPTTSTIQKSSMSEFNTFDLLQTGEAIEYCGEVIDYKPANPTRADSECIYLSLDGKLERKFVSGETEVVLFTSSTEQTSSISAVAKKFYKELTGPKLLPWLEKERMVDFGGGLGSTPVLKLYAIKKRDGQFMQYPYYSIIGTYLVKYGALESDRLREIISELRSLTQ